MLEMPESFGTSQEELLTECRISWTERNVLQSTKLKGCGGLKNTLTWDLEVGNLEFSLPVFSLALVKCFLIVLHFLPFELVVHVLCRCVLQTCDLSFVSYFPGDYSKEIAMSLWRNIGLLNSVETMLDYGDFWNLTECIFFIVMWLQVYGVQEVEWCGLTRNGPHMLLYWMSGD